VAATRALPADREVIVVIVIAIVLIAATFPAAFHLPRRLPHPVVRE
jgi:hypothetical protein